MYSHNHSIRSIVAKAVRKLARDERGDALQNVLLLAVAAVGIYLGFNLIWGSKTDPGFVQQGITTLIKDKFLKTFTDMF